MKILVMTPLAKEVNWLLHSCAEQGIRSETLVLGKLPVTHFPALGIIVAQGGLGKVQFAVQTQHLIETCPGLHAVICAGAAGALVDALTVGDVVVATETVEHDMRNKFGPPLLPRFRSEAGLVETFKNLPIGSQAFQVHFGPIASGDEDVIDAARRQAIHQVTGALVVAWEGAGGARACQFSGLPFVEIRGVTDSANSTAAADFARNLHRALGNVATVITGWAKAYWVLGSVPRPMPNNGMQATAYSLR
jgi:adenosylhomocysteine nucleosidase